MSSLPKEFSKTTQVVLARADGPEFNLLDRKVFNVLYANAYRRMRANPHDRTPHSIKLRDLARAVQQPHDDLRKVRESLERLWSVKIAVEFDTEEGEPHALRCHYLSYTTSKLDGGDLLYCFDDLLLQVIAHQKVYALIELNVSSAMTSVYGSKLYEAMSLVVRMMNPKWDASLEELREYFELGDKYDRFDQLKRKVIDRAIDDVNKHAPFRVTAEYIREGRGGKVTDVVFKALPKRTDEFGLVPSSPKAGDDMHTIDMFEGVSRADKLVPPDLRSDTIMEAERLMGPDADIPALREQWFGIYGARVHSSPDEMFLSWIRVQKERLETAGLEDLDLDALLNDVFN